MRKPLHAAMLRMRDLLCSRGVLLAAACSQFVERVVDVNLNS